MVTAVMFVPTLLVHICVHVIMDTVLILIVTTAQVCANNNILIEILFITDINECDTSNGGCGQDCINTIGSYQCQCREGYETNNNGINCTGTYEY